MTVTPISIAWSAIAVFGLLFTAWVLWDNVLNLQAVRDAARLGRVPLRGRHWWLAVGSLGSSVGFAFVWLGFLAVGGMAMLDTWIVYAGWLLIAMELVLMLVQAWQLSIRTKIRQVERR